MNIRLAAVVGAFLVSIPMSAGAGDEPAVVGRWQTIDEKTNKPTSVIRTWIKNGKLHGTIEKLTEPGADPNATCTKCSGALKDKPIVGLTIMWGLTEDGAEWTGGSIVDPGNGDVYKCKVKAVGADGLEVRGFVGVSLFGRSQTWRRVR